jgi:hypothetical protein
MDYTMCVEGCYPLSFVGDLPEEFHDLTAATDVEGGGRLIGQEHARLVGQGTSCGHALLLPTGERRRKVLGTSGDFEMLKEIHGPP